jgi:hypothetical protein
MLLLDGSLHRRLEDRGPQLTLLGLLDDPTRKVPVAGFFPREDAHGYFHLLRRYGAPSASMGTSMGSSCVTTITGRSKNNSRGNANLLSSVALLRNSASPTFLPQPSGQGSHRALVGHFSRSPYQ